MVEKLISPRLPIVGGVPAEKLISPRTGASVPGVPEKLISPRPATGFSSAPDRASSPAGSDKPPQKAKPVELPVAPPEPTKKLISPNLPVPFTALRPSAKRLSVPKPPKAPTPPQKLIIPNEGKARRVAAIKDISRTKWRDDLLPAHFDNCLFHVESGSRESGRRIVVHEFPKRDLPYSEDMGRSAITFTVRAYCIVYPRDLSQQMPLYLRDYRVARNILQERLDRGGAGTLQLPTFRPVRCVCQRYRMTEEEKFGGYVVFDMQFVEVGVAPFRTAEDTEANMLRASKEMQLHVLRILARPHTAASQLPRAETRQSRMIGRG